VVEHQLGPAVSRRVLAEQRPGVGVDVVAVEVALQGLAVPDAGVQVAAERVDLPSLGVDAHLVARASAGTALIGTRGGGEDIAQGVSSSMTVCVLLYYCISDSPLSLCLWRYRTTGSPGHCKPRSRPGPACRPSPQTGTRSLKAKRSDIKPPLWDEHPALEGTGPLR